MNGEGLQHEDGHSLLLASTIPNLLTYDPAYAYEVTVIIQDGLKRMVQDQEDTFYYITLMNENYAQPDLPAEAHQGVLRGCYMFNSCLRMSDGRESLISSESQVTLLGSGAILTEVIRAAEQLAAQGVTAHVISVTSWSELERDGQACASRGKATPWIAQVLQRTQGPVIAATDYVRAVPEAVRAFMPAGRRYVTLGTDGFGRSDTRAALRRHFGVDAASVAQAALAALR